MQPLYDKHFTLSTAALVRMVQDARERTLELVADLEEAQFEVPLLALVNPFRWELGHVTFFYEMFLLQLLGQTKPLLVGAEDLYDSFKIDHDDRWSLPLPSRQQTFEYMQRVLDAVVERLQGHDPSAQETYLYLLSVLHEDMHGEALTYMRQTLSYPAPQLGSTPAALGSGPWPGDVAIPGGTFYLGATPDQPFVFDNEKWAHPVAVRPFRMARAPVTNAEFAAFVEDGGYRQRRFWSDEGWRWRDAARAEHPLYWVREGRGFTVRRFQRSEPLPPHQPVVHLNWYEASAWCRWAGRRLPTELEWEVAASTEPVAEDGLGERKRLYPWGDAPPGRGHANLEGGALCCVDVAAYAAGDSAWGCRQMIGNVWEWTASVFEPYPGFSPDAYQDYSEPWFGTRKVLRGGSWATRGRMITNTYRNFFTPERRDVFSGFRTATL